MRFEGDLTIIENIEQIILDKTGNALISRNPSEAPCDSKYLPTFVTKLYAIFFNPYVFDVRLTFDYRNKTGRFDLKDANSQVLFVRVPEITGQLSLLDKMLVSKKVGNEYRVNEISLR